MFYLREICHWANVRDAELILQLQLFLYSERQKRPAQNVALDAPPRSGCHAVEYCARCRLPPLSRHLEMEHSGSTPVALWQQAQDQPSKSRRALLAQPL